MLSNNLSTILVQDSKVDNQPFEVEENDIKETWAEKRVLPMLAAQDVTKQYGHSLAVGTSEGLAALKMELQDKYGFHDILSKSPLMDSIFRLINDLANAKATVLIEGDTGTGKEQIARAIHRVAQRPGP